MGVSPSAALVIVGIGALFVLSTVAGVGGNVAERVSEAGAASLEDERETLRTEIAITEAAYHYDGTYLSITIENTGSRPIHLTDTDLVLDGTYRRATIADVLAIGEFQRTVGGSPATDILLPGESLHLEWETVRSDRLVVVAEHGVTATSRIEIVRDATILAPDRDRAHVETHHRASIVSVGEMDGGSLDTFEIDYSTAPGVGVTDVVAADIEATAEGTPLSVTGVSATADGVLTIDFDGTYTVDLGDKIQINVSNVTNPNSSGGFDVPITIADEGVSGTIASETDDGTLRIDPASKAMLYADDNDAGAVTNHDAYFLVESGDAIVGERYTQFEIDYDAHTNADLSGVSASDVTIEIDRGGDGEVDVTQSPQSVDTSTDPLTATVDDGGGSRPTVQAGDVVRVNVSGVQNPTFNGNFTVPITVYAEPQGDLADPQTTTAADAFLLIPGVSSWPMFGFDEGNTGHGTALFGPIDDAAEIWRTATNGEVRSAPAVIQTAFTGDFDAVYVGSNDGSVYALWSANGTVRWSYGTGGKVTSGPAIENDTVFVGSNDGTVYALERDTGSEKWTFDTAGKVQASPTVVGETVYVGSLDTDVYALNATTGATRWEFETGGEIHTTPAVVGGTVYVASKGEKTLYALNATDGSVEWQHPVGEVLGGPAVNGSFVYVGNSSGDVTALDATTGALEWTYDAGDAIDTSPAVAAGTVFVGDTAGDGYALDADTGTLEWSTSGGWQVHSSPAFVSDTIYVGASDGNVYALDAADGSLRWSFATGGEVRSSPAVTNGIVYVGSDDADLYAVGNPFPMTLAWETAGDWDATADDFGVIHESDPNTDWEGADAIQLGYPSVDQGGSELAAFWAFDEDGGSTAHDVSGNGHDGTTNGVQEGVTGMWGGTAYEFDGSDDYVDLGTSNMGISGSGMAISAWLSFDDLANGDQRIVSKATSTAEQDHWWMLSERSDSPRFRLKTADGTTTTLLASGTDLPTSTTIHLVAVYDGSEMRLYYNGNEVASTAKTGRIATDDTVPVDVGRNPDDSNYFDGAMDEVRLWNRSLSASEVQSLYDVGQASGTNGHLVTDWKRHDVIADVSQLELRNVVATLPANTGIAVYVETDTDGDGSFEERSDPVSLDGTGGPHAVTGLATDTDRFRLRIELDTDDPTASPSFSGAELHET